MVAKIYLLIVLVFLGMTDSAFGHGVHSGLFGDIVGSQPAQHVSDNEVMRFLQYSQDTIFAFSFIGVIGFMAFVFALNRKTNSSIMD